MRVLNDFYAWQLDRTDDLPVDFILHGCRERWRKRGVLELGVVLWRELLQLQLQLLRLLLLVAELIWAFVLDLSDWRAYIDELLALVAERLLGDVDIVLLLD